MTPCRFNARKRGFSRVVISRVSYLSFGAHRQGERAGAGHCSVEGIWMLGGRGGGLPATEAISKGPFCPP